MTHFELAKLCHQVYTPDSIEADWIGGMGPLAAVIRGTPTVVVFRGSADVAGWIQNFDIRLALYIWGSVHGGFDRDWQTIRTRVRKAVGEGPVILTGHSLGGALATIAAADFPNAEVVTFGTPRCGDATFSTLYSQAMKLTTRYVYRRDPVPWLPGLLAGYRHATTARWFNGDHWQDGYSWLQVLKLAFDSLVNLVISKGDWVAWLRKFRADHDIENYITALTPEPIRALTIGMRSELP